MTNLHRDEHGVAYVEFLIVFIPIFVLFMCIAQMALLAVAKLVVQHAATRGARAAMVILADDPKYYEDGSDVGRFADAQDINTLFFQRLVDFIDPDKSSENASEVSESVSRMKDIRTAALFPMLSIAPQPTTAGVLLSAQVITALGGTPLPVTTSLSDALGESPAARVLTVGLGYFSATVAITFPAEPGSDELIDGDLSDADSFTLRVSYLFACSVPIASGLMCDHLDWSKGDAPTLSRTVDVAESDISDDDKATNQRYADLEHLPHPEIGALIAGSGARFLLLRSEATLPLRYAAYVEAEP